MKDREHSIALRSVDLARIICALHTERATHQNVLEQPKLARPEHLAEAAHTVNELTDLIARMGKALLRAHEDEMQ